MEELKSAMGEHMDQMADLVEKLTAELRSGLRPAFDNFIGFFNAIDWTEPWLICLMSFDVVLLLVVIISRKISISRCVCFFLHVNTLFSLCYLIVTWKRAELRHRARLSHNKQD